MIGFLPGVPDRGARPGPRAPDLPAAAPLRRGLLHVGARPAPQRAPDRRCSSIPLVFATMAAVAVVAHEVDRAGVAEAFVLGAIVSPTDAVAPAEIMRRIGRAAAAARNHRGREPDQRLDGAGPLPRRGGGGRHRAPSRSGRRARSSSRAASAAWPSGLAAGWIIREVRAPPRRPAHRDHHLDPVRLRGLPPRGGARLLGRDRCGHRRASTWAGTRRELTTPVMRLQGMAVWEILTFLLNALLFLLVGLQLPSGASTSSRAHAAGELIGWGAARERGRDRRAAGLGCSRSSTLILRRVDRRESQRARRIAWQERLVRRLGRDARLGVARGRARHPAREPTRATPSRTAT